MRFDDYIYFLLSKKMIIFFIKMDRIKQLQYVINIVKKIQLLIQKRKIIIIKRCKQSD